jgi:uncharacterized protein
VPKKSCDHVATMTDCDPLNSIRNLSMAITFALLLILVLLACGFLTLLGLPGNWLMIAATAVYACLVPAHSPAAIGWKTVMALIVLAALGEVVELLAGAVGTARVGGSRRGAVLALIGSIVGGILGIFIGLPVPIVGSILAVVLFAALGAMVGAILGEAWSGKSIGTSWHIAKAAFWGRLTGTVCKLLLGIVMVVIVVMTLLL